MTSQSEPNGAPPHDYEYPDAAGYPDGTGTLDEGTRPESDVVPGLSEVGKSDGDSRNS